MSLAGVGGDMSRIRLATLATVVRLPCHHLAKIAASVDLISRGRLTFGIGAGFPEAMYPPVRLGVSAAPATQIRQMEEAVD